jgi:RecA/RadA recombinase
MKTDNFLEALKTIDPEIDEEIVTTSWIDTGAYAFNALLSGSIYGGFAGNRVTALAGEQSVGKTYFALSAVKQYLMDHPTSRCIYYDTEFSLDKKFLKARGVDEARIHFGQADTLEEYRSKMVQTLEMFKTMKDRPDVMMVVDSLGNLSTAKEVADTMATKDTKDMTRPGVVRSIFRQITRRVGRLNIPLIVTNHTYEKIGAYVPTKEMSGGGGLKYAASTIIFLSKKNEDITGLTGQGAIIVAKTDKSRFTKEKKKVELWLDYNTGLDRYYGLIPIATDAGIFVKGPKMVQLPDGSQQYEKTISKDPERFFTKEILTRIDVRVCSL